MAETQAGRAAGREAGAEGEFFPLHEGMQTVRNGLAPVSLLVVDDDQHVREVCRSVAAECGMKAVDVSTAEEALEVMEFSPVDILLTDLRLPGTNGRISVEEAVAAYTRGSAYARFSEDTLGTLEAGKEADLAVLSQDIFTVAHDSIAKTKVLTTMVGGKVVFQQEN